MNYKDRFITALEKTKNIGLLVQDNPLPFQKKFKGNKKRSILLSCVQALKAHGFRTSSDLASQCTFVHLMLRDVLKQNLNIDSVITIGDRYWKDYIYCEMSYESIVNELSNPESLAAIKAHVWLTLPDGTILDCTGEAHADLLFERGEHPVEQCLMYLTPDIRECADSGYHRPFLIGEDFLVKSRVIGKD